ncbi:putative heme-binding domain-containing protein [Prosthecobacter debontii]|uniref:Putative heme-binding domain-containing protein n=1 Tax=Prosthecobacter debontii TaxID=48467 RepID=A0A1T4XVQ4_9BACT|nr:family 16 glycoside hydrolase [Prosthecobacter debontii]SKA93278.1 putative heme-binding domain-containing protein [Prosthecobacter debontii]
MKFTLLFATLLSTAWLTAAQAEEGFRSLFNGKDLSGWDGNPELWRVEEGCITGETTGPEQLSYNQFLVWRGGEVKNFELRIKAKVTGNNTGIQYRSKALPEVGKWSIGGYQCDIHPAAPNNAMVYEERGRGIICQNGQSVVIDEQGGKWLVAERDPVAADVAEWNEYTVIAQGNHLIHKLNGKVTIDLVDHEPKAMALSGLLAFQIHRGPAMRVQIKEVMFKELPEGGLIPFAKTDIPNDAQKIEKPAPAKKAPAGPKAAKGKPAPAKGTPAKAKAAAKAKRPDSVGPAIGENKATPVDRIKAPKDFKVELLYSVPGGEQGSWVALCADDKGRIYASDQYGDLYRFSPPAAGQPLKEQDIVKVPVNVRAINGMVFAFGALYAGVNDYEQKMQSGLYRISDTNADDLLDKVELLRAFDSKSDHGVHAVVPSPDGKSLFLITGNNAVLAEGPEAGTPDTSPVRKVWGDDHLLPRMPDGRGHNRHVLAPGGIVYRVTPDGQTFEIFASGFRNIYDGAFNQDGELFTYDADMEYDFNTPWYRPTRVNHVVSGGEYGWRNGAGKYPEFYADSLPATLNIGPGSPTGVAFGYGAKFPAKYQEAFYIMDWSWGKLYAVHLQPDGASYKATKEDFITGAPLPLTDMVVNPQDGALYFAIGGRRVQSGLYRVTYVGTEDTSPVVRAAMVSNERELRHELEAFHGKSDPKAVDFAWPHLNHADRFIRSAARVAIEHQPVAKWKDKALEETDAGRQLEALLALARLTGLCPSHRAENASVDATMRDALLAALLKLDWAKLTPDQRLTYVRVTQIVLHRFGNPDDATVQALIAKLDPAFPAPNFELNWLLCETLCYLQAPHAAAKGMALIAQAESQEPQMEYARSLRMLKAGWTPELRKVQLEWFLKAANYKGGASFDKFIEFIRNDSLATFTEAEKTEHAELIAKKPERKSAIENVGAMFLGRTPTMWTLDELSKAAETGMTGRSFDNGRKMFGAAGCFACHRFGNAGGMTGPDLTGSGGRYSPHDLLDQIINPSKEINEQFAPILVTKNNGEILTGVVVNLSGDGVTLNTDASDPNQRVNVDRKEVKSIELSKVSPMPPMLLAMLKKEEILDLLAYVLSGGDSGNAMFKK